MTQQPLPFHRGAGPEFAGFFPGPNAGPLAAVRAAARDRRAAWIYLWGAQGTGKSHLLLAACAEAAGRGPVYLDAGLAGPGQLEGLAAGGLVCLDGLEHAAGDAAWESSLFTLLNRLRESGSTLLAAGRCAPGAGDWRLPDLKSRLSWGGVYRLQTMGDGDKLAALRDRAVARGLDLPDEVGRYLLSRAPRNPSALFALLERLDAAALAGRRRLTIPLVRSVLTGSHGL